MAGGGGFEGEFGGDGTGELELGFGDEGGFVGLVGCEDEKAVFGGELAIAGFPALGFRGGVCGCFVARLCFSSRSVARS